ncbi:hypothetical protein HDU93_003899 [Gonapodya sp. JEL0774]|nr:hypothetical protein HDU93_003899 [Gonapodya sp. JEL0774]
METLPVETLHRIFRYLPPWIFYSVVPRLSRRLGECSLDAIPGCPGGSVGVEWVVNIIDIGAPRQEVLCKEEFASWEVSPGRWTGWTAISVLQEVTLADFAALQPPDLQRGVSGGPTFLERCAAFCPDLIPAGRIQGTFHVSHAIWSVLPSSLSNADSNKHVAAWFQKFLTLVCNSGVPRVSIGDGKLYFVDVPDTMPLHSGAECVQEIIAESRDYLGNSLLAARLLHLFPNARRLDGTVFRPQSLDLTDPSHLGALVSKERRDIVTSISMWLPNRIPMPCFAELLNIYPNIETVEAFILLDKQVRHMSFRHTSAGARVLALSVSVYVGDLEVLMSEEMHSISNALIHQLPRLRKLSIDVLFHTQRSVPTPNLTSYMKLGILMGSFITLLSLRPGSKIRIGGNISTSAQVDLLSRSRETWPARLQDWKGDRTVIIQTGKVGH